MSKPSANTKVYVLHDQSEWVQPLLKALEALNVPHEAWLMSADNSLLDLSADPPHGVFFNRVSPSSHLRGHRFSCEYASLVLAWLEAHGRAVVNGSTTMLANLSKAAAETQVRAYGVDTPNTTAVVGKQNLLRGARARYGDDPRPFLLKHNRAGSGKSVQLFHTLEELEAFVKSPAFEEPVDGITLLQDFVSSELPYIYRLEFVGGELLYALHVRTTTKVTKGTTMSFDNCPADVCEYKPGQKKKEKGRAPAAGDVATQQSQQFSNCPLPSAETKANKFEVEVDFSHPVVPKLQRWLAHRKIAVAGIEFMLDAKGRAVVFDINLNTNYNEAAERRAKVPQQKTGNGALASYLASELLKVR